MKIKKIGVVGCGLMGSGIAQVCAQSGYQVVVLEANDKLLKKGLASIDSVLTRRVEKGSISQQDKDATMAHIKGTTDINDLADCDLVEEVVSEDLELKKKVFAQLDKICPKHAILGTNTSCLSVMDMAAVTKRPDKVLGIHFHNPAPVMRLLEIAKTIETSDETVEIVKEFGTSVGKTPVVAPDIPGFIVTRLFTPFLLGAVRMVEAGLATKEDIDTACKLALGHPMGPLEVLDLIGLDTEYSIDEIMYEDLKESQYAAPILLKKMVTAGRLGRKTGKGFYNYK
jgi:3-hydroxybutyryl-CoA dehydrogenase